MINEITVTILIIHEYSCNQWCNLYIIGIIGRVVLWLHKQYELNLIQTFIQCKLIVSQLRVLESFWLLIQIVGIRFIYKQPKYRVYQSFSRWPIRWCKEWMKHNIFLLPKQQTNFVSSGQKKFKNNQVWLHKNLLKLMISVVGCLIPKHPSGVSQATPWATSSSTRTSSFFLGELYTTVILAFGQLSSPCLAFSAARSSENRITSNHSWAFGLFFGPGLVMNISLIRPHRYVVGPRASLKWYRTILFPWWWSQVE